MSGNWDTSPRDDTFGAPSSARTVVRPSRSPEIAAGSMLVASLALSLLVSGGSDSDGPAALVALFGYLLTPFGVVGALAVARRSGLKNLDDPWFDRVRLRGQMRLLQFLAIGAFLLAVPHIIVLARFIQGALGLGA
jgi:hypothetical protein